jgi:hypothetical protein
VHKSAWDRSARHVRRIDVIGVQGTARAGHERDRYVVVSKTILGPESVVRLRWHATIARFA